MRELLAREQEGERRRERSSRSSSRRRRNKRSKIDLEKRQTDVGPRMLVRVYWQPERGAHGGMLGLLGQRGRSAGRPPPEVTSEASGQVRCLVGHGRDPGLRSP